MGPRWAPCLLFPAAHQRGVPVWVQLFAKGGTPLPLGNLGMRLTDKFRVFSTKYTIIRSLQLCSLASLP